MGVAAAVDSSEKEVSSDGQVAQTLKIGVHNEDVNVVPVALLLVQLFYTQPVNAEPENTEIVVDP